MKYSRPIVLAAQAAAIVGLCLAFGQLALAQYAEQAPPRRADDQRISAQEQRARGVARCRDNRGVDCDTPAGQKEWVNQERPISDEERARAAGARRAREGPPSGTNRTN